MRSLWFLLGLVLLAGCSLPSGDTPPPQTSASAAKESRTVANLKVEYDQNEWEFNYADTSTNGTETVALRFHGNGLECWMDCPELRLIKFPVSNSKKLADVLSGLLPICKDGSGKVRRMATNDITVGGVKAEYYSSDSCSKGEKPDLVWVIQEQRLVIGGTRMKDGYFPTEEVARLLDRAIWVS